MSVAGCSSPNSASTVFGPEPQRGRAAGMIDRPTPPPSPAADRPARRPRRAAPAPRPWRRSASKRLRLAAAPVARAALAGEHEAERRPLGIGADSGGRSRTGGSSAAPRSALRCAAASRPGSSEGRMTFSSSLIGLASVQAPPPNGAASASETKLHVTASFSPRAAAARRTRALERLRRRRGRARRRPRRAAAATDGIASIPSIRIDLLDEIGRRLRRRAASSARSRVQRAVDREAEPLRGSPRCRSRGDRRGRRACAASAGSIARSCARRSAACRRAIDLGRLAAGNVEHQPRRDREPGVEEGGIDAALEAAARVGGQAERLAGAGDASRDRNRRIRSARRWSSRSRPNARRP